MSLNWLEINAVISELDIVGAQLQRIVQPAWDTVLLSLYKPGRATQLLFCVAHGACRLHETDYQIPKTLKPQRFTELLRSHVRGSRVESIVQIGNERIVRIRFGRDDEACDLYARLWSGAANLILTRPDGTIIDALARKPARGEISGGHFVLPTTNTTNTTSAAPTAESPSLGAVAAASGNERSFSIRQLTGEGSFNKKIDEFYAHHGSELSREALVLRATAWLDNRRSTLTVRRASLEDRARAYADPDRFRELGDILMANLHRAQDFQLSKSGRSFLDCEDFFRGGSVLIPVDRKRDLVGNAKILYEKAKKAKSGGRETAIELELVNKSLQELATLRLAVEQENNPHQIRGLLQKWKQSGPKETRRFPGLSLEKDGWLLLIGRTAAENDQLLRRYVRGNDTWLHARDHSGAYVFIKSRKDKSIPLELLLDAGNLAVYYSKARRNGQADLYYTRVKYLRRAKDGPKGLVIPTQEKNIHIKLEEDRLRQLRRLIGHDDE
ncbi:MAG: NFACT family protein [Spirochaetes bacterium]|nr:NFACT family protein [Spirochaetota bacterium]